MLSLKELVIRNNQQDLILVDRLSFTLNNDDKIAIIGSEGSGKTTLLSVIAGQTPAYISVTGEMIRPRIVGYLEQNIGKHWGAYKVSEYLEEFILSENRCSYYDTIPRIADTLGINYSLIENRLISSFSGGEKVKIGLLKILMMEPDVLLLDEPSNDLDFDALIFLETFLKEIRVPVIFISHDQRLLENVSNGIIHLEHLHKKTTAKTTYLHIGYKAYKEKYASKYHVDLMQAKKQRSNYKNKMERFNQVYHKVEHQQNQAVRNPVLGRLLKKKMHSLKSQEKRYLKEKEAFVEIPEKEASIHLFFEEKEKSNTKRSILDLKIADFKLKNGVGIKKIELVLRGKEKIAITGKNGIGKTTLIKYIFKLLDDKDVNIGYASQNYMDILVEDENPVSFLMKRQEKYNEFRIRQILGNLGLKKEEMLYAMTYLSEGTKLKVILLLMVSRNFDLLILDEPTRNISPLNQDKLYELFASFDGPIIAVTHDRAFLEMVFDSIYELKKDGLVRII